MVLHRPFELAELTRSWPEGSERTSLPGWNRSREADLLRFEERVLEPYTEPVSPEELKTGGLKTRLDCCETVRCTFPGSQESKWKSRFRGIHL
jgi:hypothetical protein